MMDSTPLYDEPIRPVDQAMNSAFTRRIKPRMRRLHPVGYYYIALEMNPHIYSLAHLVTAAIEV